jgi:GMP synthase (glutamine-hydrolysing)
MATYEDQQLWSSVWIVDLGSQYTNLILRRLRELGYASLLFNQKQAYDLLKKGTRPTAIILSGGPRSAYEDLLHYDVFFQAEIPLLGICYGMQLLALREGWKVVKGHHAEFGRQQVFLSPQFSDSHKSLFSRFDPHVWMSHRDHVVSSLNSSFDVIVTSADQFIAGIEHKKYPWMGFQFHPEVEHSEEGISFLKYFLEKKAQLRQNWQEKDIYQNVVDTLSPYIGQHVLCAFSGGVDSLVAASMAYKVFGNKLHCYFVDHGLLRPQDKGHMQQLQKYLPFPIHCIEAKDEFRAALEGITDPEKKRKIIGHLFIDVFEKNIQEIQSKEKIVFDYLLQGTLYPDVIESSGTWSAHHSGPSVMIKSHHNVGGLPDKMRLKVIEPFRLLFKDEVRLLGRQIGLDPAWIERHPFPGPGLAIRIMGEVTAERLKRLGQSDQILHDELHRAGLYGALWQAFTVYLPIKTVGVKGDGRCEEEVICLRAVHSSDGMTASAAFLPWNFLERVATRISNEVEGITRVVYDLTSKPPGTIEWE